ncbi:AAA family ATPase [Aeromicrobium wangtongii]|uniref:AAA family ATPase n=1 Tax=Aeromicrobium wangtongii TaxID=2969247 RepID=A0ABY5MA12_9ACTN|nr:AAA family ATPase [Aeromicrobium wangtongii]MCD9197478.1 AAA family ATPase [Aeromicrobium wangtongii]UUP14970.1 AAA family ATPase [Aeromicrobium wangtongii]
MSAEERRPEGNRDGAIEEVLTGSTSGSSLSVDGAAAVRIDYWDLHVLDVFTAPHSDVATMRAAHDEIYRRFENFAARFGNAALTQSAVPDDLYGLGRTDAAAATDRFADSLIPGTPHDEFDLEMLELLLNSRRWEEIEGRPYALPPFVTGETAVASEDNAGEIVAALTLARDIHDAGGHDAARSLVCDECVPHPALAVATLAATSLADLKALIASDGEALERLRRETEKRRGTTSLLDLIADSQKAVPMLEGVVPAEGVGVIAGPSGSGKTFLASHIAVGVAAGREGAVYAPGEGRRAFGSRIEAEAERRGVPLVALAEYMTIVHAMPDLFARDQGFSDLLKRAERDKPKIIVIDTLALASGEAIQDNAGHMSKVMGSAQMLADASGGVVVLVAHTGKRSERGIRGSSAIGAAADWILTLSRSGQRVTVSVDKLRDGADGGRFTYRSRPMGKSLVLDRISDTEPEPVDAEPVTSKAEPAQIPDRILAVLDGAELPLSTSQIAAGVNDDGGEEVALSTIRRHLAKLSETGEIQASGENRDRVYESAK